MTQKEKYEMILEEFNIKEYFDRGFKGQDVKIASIESLTSDHGRKVYLTLKTYAPLCDVYSFNDEFGISAVGDQNTIDTIMFPKFVEWCIEKKIDIITSSLCWGTDEKVEREGIQRLYDNGIIFLNCAGNDGDEDNLNEGYDASNIDVGVISVSGVTINDKGEIKWAGRDYGSAIDVLGVSENLPILYDADKFMAWSGTSAATPFIASMFAVLKSYDNRLNSKNVDKYIEDYSSILTHNSWGYLVFEMPKLTKTWQEEFKESWDKATLLGVVDGTRPNNYITRNELIVILDRLNLLK